LKFGNVISGQVFFIVVDTRIFVPDNVHRGGGGGGGPWGEKAVGQKSGGGGKI